MASKPEGEGQWADDTAGNRGLGTWSLHQALAIADRGAQAGFRIIES